GGSYYFEAKEIESEYRKVLELNQKQLTYFYFPSYHFKAPFEFSELENVYYVVNPEIMLERKSLSSKSANTNYKIIFHKENNAPTWWESLKKLEDIEIKQPSKNLESSTFHLSQEMLSFSDGKNLTLSGKKLNELNLQTRIGEFGLTGNLLKDSSLKNDDIFYSLYFLSRIYYGYGFAEILNAKDTHTAYFLKSFLEEKSENQGFQERFYEGYSQSKTELKEDRFFVGWKPITNVFLSE
ncbi:MAG: hypothetical protein N3A69_08835, partial [Leptospiraceae bacterium]|nr:hypothetical protein [Leptospiraceae bacterium]